jgi:hypothetical protein
VCEPVLAEAMHLLARFPRGQDALFGLLVYCTDGRNSRSICRIHARFRFHGLP